MSRPFFFNPMKIDRRIEPETEAEPEDGQARASNGQAGTGNDEHQQALIQKRTLTLL